LDSCSTSCSNPSKKRCGSGRADRWTSRFRPRKGQRGHRWTGSGLIRDREAPGSNPGPPTSFWVQTRRFSLDDGANGSQPCHRFACESPEISPRDRPQCDLRAGRSARFGLPEEPGKPCNTADQNCSPESDQDHRRWNQDRPALAGGNRRCYSKEYPETTPTVETSSASASVDSSGSRPSHRFFRNWHGDSSVGWRPSADLCGTSFVPQRPVSYTASDTSTATRGASVCTTRCR
jgi:hypothetical protein